MSEQLIATVRADASQYEEAMKRVGEEPGRAANRAKSGFNALNKFMDQTQKRADVLKRMKIAPVVQLIDRISAPIRKIESNLGRLTKSIKKITIEAVDKTASVVKRITGALTSPLGMLGAGAGIYGIGKLTLGAAMDFETQAVSMEHWLQGNKKAAQEFTDWLDMFAAKTPFEMEDLFPAGSRALGVSEGDISVAQRLIKLSADMAGLTPGKTVRDAMEALADAQMGEFERMKEFNMKLTKEEMDAAGGFFGAMSQIESKFAGGAEKLSATAKGRISTITDFLKTQFRSAGKGMLEALSPRLKKISDWFDKNPEKVAYWKNKLVSLGKETFEGILSKGEVFLGKLMAKFEDPGFQKLNWGGKLAALIGEVESVVIPAAGRAGAKIGTEFGVNFAKGVIDAITSDYRVSLLVGAWAGSKVPGPAWAKLAVAAGIAYTPGLKEVNRINADLALQDYYDQTGYNPTSMGAFRAIDNYAVGGFANKPSIFGEAGLEVAIPLSSRLRSRALDLWQETGKRLGVMQYATGGYAGSIPAMAGATVGGAGINLNVQADVNVSLVGADIDYNSMANEIGWRIVTSIKQTLENRG